MNIKYILAITIFVSLFITACGGGSNETTNQNETLDTNDTNINGTWVNSCEELTTPSFNGSAIWSVKFSTNIFTANIIVFESLDCKGNSGASKTMTGITTVGEPFTATDSGKLVNRIDIEITGTDEPPNSIGFDSSEISYNYGNTYYDIFYKVGDTIYFGDKATGDGITSEQRPSEIDFNNIYRLQ